MLIKHDWTSTLLRKVKQYSSIADTSANTNKHRLTHHETLTTTDNEMPDSLMGVLHKHSFIGADPHWTATSQWSPSFKMIIMCWFFLMGFPSVLSKTKRQTRAWGLQFEAGIQESVAISLVRRTRKYVVPSSESPGIPNFDSIDQWESRRNGFWYSVSSEELPAIPFDTVISNFPTKTHWIRCLCRNNNNVKTITLHSVMFCKLQYFRNYISVLLCLQIIRLSRTQLIK